MNPQGLAAELREVELRVEVGFTLEDKELGGRVVGLACEGDDANGDGPDDEDLVEVVVRSGRMPGSGTLVALVLSLGIGAGCFGGGVVVDRSLLPTRSRGESGGGALLGTSAPALHQGARLPAVDE